MAISLRGPVLVRTWFADDSAWESLIRSVQTPSEEGFLANLILVNDPALAGLSAEGLKETHQGNAFVAFLADETTLRDAGHPILAVWVYPVADDDPRDLRPFRVVAAEVWSVENNINLANMDWHDFTDAADGDGIFRGF
jgi:hypothetical protein